MAPPLADDAPSDDTSEDGSAVDPYLLRLSALLSEWSTAEDAAAYDEL